MLYKLVMRQFLNYLTTFRDSQIIRIQIVFITLVLHNMCTFLACIGVLKLENWLD